MIHCYFPAYGGIIKKPFIVEHNKDSITIANYGIDYWYKYNLMMKKMLDMNR
jgi:hypothetical protein